MSLDDFHAMVSVMHLQTAKELRASHERSLASMEPELRERFQNMAAQARARPPRLVLTEITPASLRELSGEALDAAVYDYVATRIDQVLDRRVALLALPLGLQVFTCRSL